MFSLKPLASEPEKCCASGLSINWRPFTPGVKGRPMSRGGVVLYQHGPTVEVLATVSSLDVIAMDRDLGPYF